MLLKLEPHPDTPEYYVDEITVDVVREGAWLSLEYITSGRGDSAIFMPREKPSGRADRLWEHTCYELFVRPVGEEGYLEFNFSPSGEWAAYRFDGYRTGMANAEEVTVGEFRQSFCGDRHELEVDLDLGGAAYATAPLQIGISAVIEILGGRKSFFALVHAPGKPDFHHPDTFAAILPAVEPV